MYYWLTVFSPSAVTLSLRSPSTNLKYPHSQNASWNDFRGPSRQAFPLPSRVSLPCARSFLRPLLSKWNFLLREWMMQENQVLPAAKLQAQHPYGRRTFDYMYFDGKIPLLKTVCLFVTFFSFLCKSNIMHHLCWHSTKKKQLTRGDIKFTSQLAFFAEDAPASRQHSSCSFAVNSRISKDPNFGQRPHFGVTFRCYFVWSLLHRVRLFSACHMTGFFRR